MRRESRLLRVFHSVLSRLLADALAVELAAHDLSAAQYRALQYVAHAGQSDISSLAAAFTTSVPAATKMADRLQAAGWVERYYSEHDRRQTMLRPTEKGHAVVQQIAGCEEAALEQVLQQLTAEERELLAGGVESFIRQALESPGLENLCLHCGETHIANCPLDLQL